MSNTWATWANLLTALRITLIAPTYLAILFGDFGLAAVLFTLAVLSDVYDGKLARKFDQATPLGGLLDHSTDAVYVATSHAALSTVGLVNPYLWPIILLAFLQYMMDSRALAGQPLRASFLGRLNGIVYFVLVGVFVGAQVLQLNFITVLASWVAWLLVVTSLVSMGDRALALLRREK